MPTVRADGAPTAVAGTPAGQPGLVLGRYRLTRRLGSGGFGTVWAARDERLERDVAVKILPRERVLGARFEREARAAARLQHPAIVTLYEAAVDDDGAYLVSELVRGRTLDQLLDKGQLSDRDILRIAISLLDALAHAHDQGVIHRDVKPSNVLVPARRLSEAHPAKLTDFGVARVVGGDALTRTGDVVGTLAYMSPEQAEGREAGPAADLYSLALVIYEALTGVNPLRGVRAAAAPRRRPGTYLPPLRRQRRDLPRQLGCGIDLALRPRPSERGSLAELRAALISSLEQADETRGVVAPGWRGHGQEHGFEDAGPGPEWAEQPQAQRGAAGLPAGGTEEPLPRAPRTSWPIRGLGAGAAGLSAGWIGAHALGPTPLAPAALALIAAGAVLLAPRLGWLVSVATLAGLAVAQNRPGAALVLAIVAALAALALVRDGELWPLPAGAVALGLFGLAGAWPAVAGAICRRWWQRAALAGAGFVWLSAAGELAGHSLYWRPQHAPAPGTWASSLQTAVHDVVIPLSHRAALGGALVWAIAAVVAPWLATRGPAGLRVVLVTIAAALTVAAVEATGARPLGAPALGAVLGGLLLLAPTLASELRGLHGARG
jgi:serine/threonine protein kinase